MEWMKQTVSNGAPTCCYDVEQLHEATSRELQIGDWKLVGVVGCCDGVWFTMLHCMAAHR